jgi:Na+-driven multidrug efflux pump
MLMLFPTIYQTVRIYFLGAMPGDWGFNIASQLSWVNLFYEVIQEAIILPLFCVLGKSYTNKIEFENKVKTGLFLTGIIYAVVSVFLIVFAKSLVVFMAQENELIDLTVNYIRLETIAALLATMFKFMYAVLVILKKDLYLYVVLGIQMLLSILLDTFLISGLDISLKIGVNGIAASNIIVNLVNLAICILLLRRESINIFSRVKSSFVWVKEWFAVGKYSGIESFVRNLAFMIMIIRMMNIVSEQGNYWIANNFIWQWLLLPALALGDLVKQEIGENGAYHDNIKNKFPGFMGLCVISSILFLATIPVWKPFLRYVMNVSSYETVYYIAIFQTAFYITFIFNNTIDSVFYGAGRTDYMLWQSLIVNIILNGGAFVLYLCGIFVPTLFNITILFGIGLFFDFIPTITLYLIMLRKMGIKFNDK